MSFHQDHNIFVEKYNINFDNCKHPKWSFHKLFWKLQNGMWIVFLLNKQHTKYHRNRGLFIKLQNFEFELSNFEIQSFQTLQTQKWKNCQSPAKNWTQKWKFGKMEIWARFYNTPSQKWNSILSGIGCTPSTKYNLYGILNFRTCPYKCKWI